MRHIAFVLLFVSTCYCQGDFSERPRNCSIDLLRYTQLESGGHVAISPFGIWTLMAGLTLGASGNSYNQLIKAFILPKEKTTLIKGYNNLTRLVLGTNDEVTLTSTNFVFVDSGFSIYPAFNRTMQNDFGAVLQVLNFCEPESVGVANKLIEQYGGELKNVLSSDDLKNSAMILLNVIAFRGLWKSPFDKADTMLEPFYDENQMVIGNVNMMTQTGKFAYTYSEPLKSEIVELPYGTDEKYSMLIILPFTNAKITDIFKNSAEVSLKDIFKLLKDHVDAYGMGRVIVKLPRFRVSTNLEMEKPLNNMGVKDIFKPHLANFEHITAESIYVSSIVHAADIEVTESGTVALAGTKFRMRLRIMPTTFYANRPFMYFIMEKTTTTVLFSGIYSKPTVY